MTCRRWLILHRQGRSSPEACKLASTGESITPWRNARPRQQKLRDAIEYEVAAEIEIERRG